MMGELREISDGCFAYLQLPGKWGYSNSGLIRSGDSTLVVDTLYDANLTSEMMRHYRRVADGARFDTVVNTHANGDHCWGNQVLPNAQVISSRAAAEEMHELSPQLMHKLVSASKVVTRAGAPAKRLLKLLGRLGVPRAAALAESADFLAKNFGHFDFGSVQLKAPDRTFERELELTVGDKKVQLIEVGPAHTRGDVIVHVPSDRVVFTGDILFEAAHPVMWEGPFENWIAACERILALDVDTVVPGHGAVTTKQSIRRLRDYWTTLADEAQKAHLAGTSALEAAMELRRTLSVDWSESERLVANIETLYRAFDRNFAKVDPLETLAAMAKLSDLPRR